MRPADSTPDRLRTRREPPRYRRVSLRRAARISPHLVRVTLGGPELDGFRADEPAASVRLLLPAPGADALVMPAWNGNEFLLADGRRPTIRTFTPRRVDPEALELDLDVVIHPDGAASAWAERAETGASVAVSGPGRGYPVDEGAPAFLLIGDESAIPAITQMLEALPSATPVRVHIEVASPDARIDLPRHPEATVAWSDLPAGGASGDTLVEAVRRADLVPGSQVWAAGEAAAMQRIRRHLFEERGLDRSQATVRGYWKHGRSEGS